MITMVSLYKEYIESSHIYTLIEKSNSYSIRKLFYKETSPNEIQSKYELISIWIKALPKILINYKSLLNTTYVIGLHFPFFIIAKAFNKINEKVIIDNFYLHKAGENKSIKKMLQFLLAGKEYTFIVQSVSEVEYYKKIAPTLNLVYLPFCMGKIEIQDSIQLPNSLPKSYLFTGGYSNRDYDLILRAAKSIKNYHFIIVMSRLNVLKEEVPDNVIILKDLDFQQFHLLLAKASGVIIPLKNNVGSSGQMLSLAAMQLGKPVIYSNNDSINHYFAYGNGISYEQNSLSSFESALERFFSLNKEELTELEEVQKKTFYNNFDLEHRGYKIMEIIQQV